eukprot:NODE_96_length_20709_cov_1.429161.p14 type:complete len:159 gc:universal NODE_96_length_20709_cov_1.429161:15575-16051(+)
MILCILGSGGHTSEMFSLIEDIDSKLIFIASKDDQLSQFKAKQKYPNSKIYTIIRPRLPAQSLLLALPRIIVSLIHTIYVVARIFYNNRNIKITLGNGPGLSLLVLLISKLCGASTVYVESFARVKTLSLSGKIAKHVVDHFIVQWKENEGKSMEWIL